MGEFRVADVAAVLALAFAAGLGALVWGMYIAWRRRLHHRAVVAENVATSTEGRFGKNEDKRLDERIVGYARDLTQRVQSPLFRPITPRALRQRPCPENRLRAAGLRGAVSSEGYWEARLRLACAGGGLGFALGLALTLELGLVLSGVGLVAGWRALPWAIDRRSRERASAMECDLAEMLDVVALGMRSGMSFDGSLDLYTGHFRTHLADEFCSAHRQWACGLATRTEALRTVADSYASPLLGRVIENIVRSLRFGSTMAGNLEDAAREARLGYKARREEAVAKAPVKMMVPTGVLILPAMLMLVLGPVLLELAGGF